MKKSLSLAALACAVAVFGLAQISSAADERSKGAGGEDYVHVPMPAGFQVIVTELEGPVFADANGRTIYVWPIDSLRNGYAGDPKDKSACGDKIAVKSAGLMSPYPPGLDLPEPDKRINCITYWPPVYAADDAKPVGDWTVIARADGKKQWAYNHHALYTSMLDHRPGDVMGGTTLPRKGEAPAMRYPAGPPPAVPPGFEVATSAHGRMLLTDKRASVYMSDADGPNKSNCYKDCESMWKPVLAPESAQAQGEWAIIQRAPGIRQWSFRKKPLYTFLEDQHRESEDGSDVPGWHNVYTQFAPAYPAGFTEQVSVDGDVLADSHGSTIYVYHCGEDSADQLPCDTLEGPQEYRLAICGDGDLTKCLKMWHYVIAGPAAKSTGHTWSTVWVDPNTGHRAEPNQPGALHVWAFRDRPVYTSARDQKPGDLGGNALGEWSGMWNGFQAFWIREEFGGRGG